MFELTFQRLYNLFNKPPQTSALKKLTALPVGFHGISKQAFNSVLILVSTPFLQLVNLPVGRH
jgi:hypothetical protein